MAYCSKCGTQLSDGEKFCPKCGNPCGDISYNTTEEGSSKSRKPLFITLAILVVFALIGGGWYFWNNQSKDYSLEGLAKVINNYDYLDNFYEGMARVTKGDKIGFIDKMGNEVIPCKFDPLEMDANLNFSNGLALVCKDNNVFYINKKGEKAFPFNYDWTCGFSEGYAIVEKGEKYGFIDTSGKEIVPCIYDYVNSFSDGMAAVIKDNKYGYIDTKGNLVIPITLEGIDEMGEASAFREGFAQIEKEGKVGFIDKSGKVVIPCKYNSASYFWDGMSIVTNGGKYGYIDTNGNEVIPCKYDSAAPFSEGLAFVSIGEKTWSIDKNGNEVFACPYSDVSMFNEGLARISKQNANSTIAGFIDRNGKEIIPCAYVTWHDFSEGLVAVSKDGIKGYVDKNGKSTFDYLSEETKASILAKIKREEQEQKRLEEEERRKWEEENKPSNRFYSFIENDSYVWEASVPYGAVKGNIDALYFEPVNKVAGKVSLVCFSSDFTSFSLKWSGNGNYTINDNAIQFHVKNPIVNISEADNDEWSETYMMIIENNGDGVRLVSEKTNQIFTQKTKHIDNPMTKYK